jgi:PAS domain S-box-containing protein
MNKQERHTLAYGVAGLLILAFFVWTFNLLFSIQNNWAESNDVTAMDKDVHALFDPWRNLNRPGNDVLENYEVDAQSKALGRYLQEYRQARGRLDMHSRSGVDLSDYYRRMDTAAQEVESLATRVLELAEERESLRLAAAEPALISAAETEAATTMARMDQAFQSGLEIIAGMDQLLDRRLLDLDEARRAGVGSLYLIVIVALFSSALSLVLLRRTSAQGEALRSGSERLNAIVNNVVDGIVTVDERGNIESLNRTAENIFGYSSNSMVGRNFRDLLHPESRTLHDVADSQYGSQSPGKISEFTGMRRDGSLFSMELEGTRISVEGRPIIIHIVRDVTERKRSEKRLQLAATVFENTSEGIMITDRNGRIQSTNPAFTAITGFAADEVLGQNPRILQSGMQTRDFYDDMWQSIGSTGHWHGEIVNRRKNGETYTQWLNINAVKDGSGQVTHYVGVTCKCTGEVGGTDSNRERQQPEACSTDRRHTQHREGRIGEDEVLSAASESRRTRYGRSRSEPGVCKTVWRVSADRSGRERCTGARRQGSADAGSHQSPVERGQALARQRRDKDRNRPQRGILACSGYR